MATTSDIKKGVIIKLDNHLYTVVDFGLNKTARSAAKLWAKLKSIDNTKTIDYNWNSGDTIYPVRVEKISFQFLYADDTGYNFMNNDTFDQINVIEKLVHGKEFLKEGQEVVVSFDTDSNQVLGVYLPDKINLKIAYAEPGIKGDTATKTLKPAELETGAKIMVPLFVGEGDTIKINTKTKEYVERVRE